MQTHAILSLTLNLSIRCLHSVAFRTFFMRLSNCVIKCKQSKFPRHSELKDTRAQNVYMLVVCYYYNK